MDIPIPLALSIYALQLFITVPVIIFLRSVRDKALLKFRKPGYSLGWVCIILLLFALAIVPLIFLKLWLLVAAVSAGLILVTLGMGFWLGT